MRQSYGVLPSSLPYQSTNARPPLQLYLVGFVKPGLLTEGPERDTTNLSGTEEKNPEYLNAIFNEALPMYPTALAGQPHRVLVEGGKDCGRFTPGETAIQMSEYATFNSSKDTT